MKELSSMRTANLHALYNAWHCEGKIALCLYVDFLIRGTDPSCMTVRLKQSQDSDEFIKLTLTEYFRWKSTGELME